MTQNHCTEKFAEFQVKICKTLFHLKFLHKLCFAKIPFHNNEADAFRLCALSGAVAGALVNSGRVCVNEKVLLGGMEFSPLERPHANDLFSLT